jgi:hypothetical protein
MRRACNDEKLYTIAKKLSYGECINSEWITQSKRSIPLLPRLQQTNRTSKPSYYKILADHILENSKPILDLYSHPSETSRLRKNDFENENLKIKKEFIEGNNEPVKKLENKSKKLKSEVENNDTKTSSEKSNILYLANGYAVSSNFVEGIFVTLYYKLLLLFLKSYFISSSKKNSY